MALFPLCVTNDCLKATHYPLKLDCFFFLTKLSHFEHSFGSFSMESFLSRNILTFIFIRRVWDWDGSKGNKNKWIDGVCIHESFISVAYEISIRHKLKYYPFPTILWMRFRKSIVATQTFVLNGTQHSIKSTANREKWIWKKKNNIHTFLHCNISNELRIMRISF